MWHGTHFPQPLIARVNAEAATVLFRVNADVAAVPSRVNPESWHSRSTNSYGKIADEKTPVENHRALNIDPEHLSRYFPRIYFSPPWDMSAPQPPNKLTGGQ